MNERSRNLLVTAPFGYSIKNLLYSSFWQSDTVKKAEKITILSATPDAFNQYFSEHSISNATAVELPSYTPSPLTVFIWQVRKTIFLERTNSSTEKIRWQTLRKSSVLRYLIKRTIISLFKVFPATTLDKLLLSSVTASSVDLPEFDTWLSLAPSFEIELPIAKQISQQYPSATRIAFIHSWDNLSSKGAPFLRFNKVLVWGELMKQEVLKKLNYTEGQIAVVGMPQYDSYKEISQKKNVQDRIVYTTGHPNSMPEELEIVTQILDQLSSKGITCEFVIRVHPNDSTARYAGLIEKYKTITVSIENPGSRTEKNVDLWKPSQQDVEHYATLLRDSRLVINIASTVTLDATFFNTPVVCISFDATKKEYQNSMRRFYDFDHYSALIKKGGITLANSPEEVAEYYKKLVKNPSINSAQKEMLTLFDPYQDGLAGKRIGDAL
jgi:hypothetical protein